MNLTPYDTGEVAQPHLWVTSNNSASLDPAVNPHADELHSRYGVVEFDDDESTTVAIVRMVKSDETGHYVLQVDAWDSNLTIETLDNRNNIR